MSWYQGMRDMTGDYYDRSGNRLTSLAEWGVLHRSKEYKTVARTEISSEVLVSTVWLGIDHSFGLGPPVIFETMIFGGPLNDSQWRYCTEAEALAGHEQAVKDARAAETPVDSLLEQHDG